MVVPPQGLRHRRAGPPPSCDAEHRSPSPTAAAGEDGDHFETRSPPPAGGRRIRKASRNGRVAAGTLARVRGARITGTSAWARAPLDWTRLAPPRAPPVVKLFNLILSISISSKLIYGQADAMAHHPANLDLNLLRVFDVLWTVRSVARRLRLYLRRQSRAQPAPAPGLRRSCFRGGVSCRLRARRTARAAHPRHHQAGARDAGVRRRGAAPRATRLHDCHRRLHRLAARRSAHAAPGGRRAQFAVLRDGPRMLERRRGRDGFFIVPSGGSTRPRCVGAAVSRSLRVVAARDNAGRSA